MENSITIHFFFFFFGQINSFIFPCSHLVLVCMHKTFLHSCKIPILHSALKNNCNVVNGFPYCYLVFTIVFNDHVLYFVALPLFNISLIAGHLQIEKRKTNIFIRKKVLVNIFMYKLFFFLLDYFLGINSLEWNYCIKIYEHSIILKIYC